MDTQTIDAYRAERRRWGYTPASQAILIARHKVKAPEFDWEHDGKGYLGVMNATTVRGGFDIAINVGYEDSPFRMYSETDDNTGIRNPAFNPDSYERRKRYISLESGTVWELAEAFRGRYYGMAKNVAFETARDSLEEQAAQLTADDYTEYVIRVKASVNGTELGFAAIGGVETGAYYGADFEKEIEDALSDSALIEEAIAEAQENLSAAIEKERAKLERMEALTT